MAVRHGDQRAASPSSPGGAPLPGAGSSRPFPWTIAGLGPADFTADPDGPIIAVYLADDRSDIGLLPAGWELRGFQENGSILTYVEPQAPGRDLSVSALDRFTTDPAREIEEFEAVQRVKFRGRTVPPFRARNFWLVEMTLLGGTKAQLTASRALTADQVAAVAASVRRSTR